MTFKCRYKQCNYILNWTALRKESWNSSRSMASRSLLWEQQPTRTIQEVESSLLQASDHCNTHDECKGSLRHPQGSSYTIPRCSSVGSLQPRPNMSTCDSTITTSSCSGATMDESTHYTLYNQLQQVTEEAESVNREALQETLRRRKAEKYATEAICRVNNSFPFSQSWS
ncbi:u-box domain-containing protein 33 [Fagus crenata]